VTVPVLFLHGWAMNGALFDDIAGRLGTDFDCHAPDLPGHGSRVAAEPSLDNCAAVARQWIERLDRPLLVGWSMGAAVAWRHLRWESVLPTLRGEPCRSRFLHAARAMGIIDERR